jgi:3-oxoacyl-[acyl-carrier-protein] synthase-1
MKRVWMLADSIVSPLGWTTGENFSKVQQGVSGLDLIDNDVFGSRPFYGGFVGIAKRDSSSRFESMCQHVIEQLLAKVPINKDRTLFILSTTKGNISFLEEGMPEHPRIHLHQTAAYLARIYGLKNHLVISNACISGVMALIVASRLISSGQFDHAVVVGADVLSRFVISGFESLHALSPERCRPFDAQRKGINLGECAAGVVLGTGKSAQDATGVYIAGGGLSNDANHISGPSRTGEELAIAIRQAFEEAGTEASDVDFISAHGTATLYNDEMEAKAIHIMDMDEIPVNSLKGYFGHTLGAAGILETILSAESLRQNQLLATAGFNRIGVSNPVNVIREPLHLDMDTCLKTASGFGGCNAAIVLQKSN